MEAWRQEITCSRSCWAHWQPYLLMTTLPSFASILWLKAKSPSPPQCPSGAGTFLLPRVHSRCLPQDPGAFCYKHLAMVPSLLHSPLPLQLPSPTPHSFYWVSFPDPLPLTPSLCHLSVMPCPAYSPRHFFATIQAAHFLLGKPLTEQTVCPAEPGSSANGTPKPQVVEFEDHVQSGILTLFCRKGNFPSRQ